MKLSFKRFFLHFFFVHCVWDLCKSLGRIRIRIRNMYFVTVLLCFVQFVVSVVFKGLGLQPQNILLSRIAMSSRWHIRFYLYDLNMNNIELKAISNSLSWNYCDELKYMITIVNQYITNRKDNRLFFLIVFANIT